MDKNTTLKNESTDSLERREQFLETFAMEIGYYDAVKMRFDIQLDKFMRFLDDDDAFATFVTKKLPNPPTPRKGITSSESCIDDLKYRLSCFMALTIRQQEELEKLKTRNSVSANTDMEQQQQQIDPRIVLFNEQSRITEIVEKLNEVMHLVYTLQLQGYNIDSFAPYIAQAQGAAAYQCQLVNEALQGVLRNNAAGPEEAKKTVYDAPAAESQEFAQPPVSPIVDPEAVDAALSDTTIESPPEEIKVAPAKCSTTSVPCSGVCAEAKNPNSSSSFALADDEEEEYKVKTAECCAAKPVLNPVTPAET